MFLACPLKYRWTYLDSRGRWYLRAKSYYSFGTTLHKVLQRFHDEGDIGVVTTDQAMSAYEESWIDAGYSSPEAMREAFGEGKAILERHIELAQSTPTLTKSLYVEKMLRLNLGEFDLIGRVDRVDEHPDGSLEIVDYKSGRTSVQPEDVQSDLAMGCYQLLLKRLHPDRSIKATIIALRTGESATSTLTEGEIEDFQHDIQELGNRILATNWDETLPVRKALCEECDFLPLCMNSPEFD